MRAAYSKLFTQLNGLKQWFRSKVLASFVGNLRTGVYERFMDLFAVFNEADEETGQVKLWSVFKHHAADLRKALERVCLDDISGADSQIE